MHLQDNRGLVSFLAVMFISVLLMMITASFVQIMSRELRQATDNELSTMAYYAAEAGVEDALRDIRQEIENDGDLTGIASSDCQSNDWDFGQGDTGFSCRLITFAPNTLEGGLGADESRQISFVGAGNTKFRLQWHSRAEGDYSAGADWSEYPDEPNNPEAAGWQGDWPPIMRVEIISYPDEAFEEEDVVQRVVFLRPDPDLVGGTSRDLGSISTGEIRGVSCRSDEGNYACQYEIRGMDQSDVNHVVRLKPFYNDTNYRIEALDGLDNPVAMPGNEAVIDVTGYANDVFRRVQARVPLGGVDTFGQDYVLLADEGVCKVMRVSRIEDSASTNDGCESN